MSKERPAYQPFEARLIQLLAWWLRRSEINVIDHLKIGELPLEIDMVAIPSEQNGSATFPPLFEYFRRYNILEVKTEQDRLETADLTKLMAYGWLYMSKQGLVDASEVTLTALVHHLPATTFAALSKLDFAEKAKGVYWRDSKPAAYVISFTEVPDELVPEALRVFCDAARRRQTFLACLGNQEKAPIVETIFDLFESEVKHIMLNIREETLRNVLSVVDKKKIISALGEEKVISALGEEKIISALGEEKIISALGKEKIIAAFKKLPIEDQLKGAPMEALLKSLSAKEIAAYVKKLRKKNPKKK